MGCLKLDFDDQIQLKINKISCDCNDCNSDCYNCNCDCSDCGSEGCDCNCDCY